MFFGFMDLIMIFSKKFRSLLLACCMLAFTGLSINAQENDPAMESYYAANALYNKRLFELAIDEYRSFIARYPRHEKILDAKFGLALSLYDLQRYAEAERLFEELAANRESPRKEQVHNLWGQCLLISGQFAKAEAAFLWSVNRGKERLFLDLPGLGGEYQEAPELSATAIQDLDPLEIALVGLVEALFRQQKWEDVIEYSGEFIRLVPEGRYAPRVRFLSGFAHYEVELYENAIPILQDIQLYGKNSPYYEHAIYLLAECQRELGVLDDAARNHEEVAREIRGSFAGNALFRLGFIRFTQGEFAKAATDFEDLRILFPGSDFYNDAGIYLGRSYLGTGEYQKAQELFGELSSISDTSAEATIWLGRTFLNQENYRQAVDVLRPAIRRFNNDPLLNQFVFEYGNALLGLEQFTQGAEVFQRVVTEFDADYLTPQALRLQAFCLMKAEDHVASLDACDQFLQGYSNDPSYRDVAFMRAENIFFLNRLDEATRAYEQFIPWENRTQYTDEARFRIIQIYAEQQRWGEALDEIYDLRENTDVSDEFFEQIDYIEGLTYFNLDRWDNAVEALERFIREDSSRQNADIAQIKLAQAYESKREVDTAKLVLEVLINENPNSQYLDQGLAEMGRLTYNDGDLDAARVYFDRVATEFPSSAFFPQAQYYLGWISLNENDNLRAISYFDRVSRDFPNNELAPDSLYKKGLLYMDLSQPGNGQIALKNFIDIYPNDERFDQASFHYGRALSQLERYGEAKTILESLIGRTREEDLSVRSLYELAWVNQGLDAPETAKARYEDILRNFPDHDLAKRANFELAEMEYRDEKYDSAIGRLDTLLASRIDRDLREKVINRMGWSLLGRGQELAAAEAFEQLLRDFPETEFFAIASYQAGEIRLGRKEYRDALPLFSQARVDALDQRVRQQAWLREAETHTFLAQWEQAEALFSEFFTLYSTTEFSRRCVMWLGWCQENLGRYEQAIANYRIVLRGRQRDELAARSQFQLGQCLMKMNELDQAVRELILVDLNFAYPTWSARSILEIGRILDKQGRAREANDRFREVMQKYPNTDEAALAEDLLQASEVSVSANF